MENIENNNKIFRESIIKLLSLDAGIQVGLGRSMYIKKHSETEYVVGGVEEKNPYQVNEWKETFKELERALDYFFIKRTQFRIGDDFWR